MHHCSKITSWGTKKESTRAVAVAKQTRALEASVVAGASHCGDSPPLSPHEAQVLQAGQEGLGGGPRDALQVSAGGVAMSLGAIRADSEVRINELLRDLGVQAELRLLPQHALSPSDPHSLVTIRANALQISLVHIFDRLKVRGRSIIVVIVVASSLALGGLLVRILPLIDVTITIAAVIGIALACWAADALGAAAGLFLLIFVVQNGSAVYGGCVREEEKADT